MDSLFHSIIFHSASFCYVPSIQTEPKGKNKASDKAESSKGGGFGNYQGKKRGFDKKKVQCYN